MSFTAGEALPVEGIVAELLDELLDELEEPDEDPLGLEEELLEDPDEELAGAPVDELDDDPLEPVELEDPEEPDDDPFDEPDDELAGAPVDELDEPVVELDKLEDPEVLDDCENDPVDKAFDTTRICPLLLADAPLEFELLEPGLLLELLELELPDPELLELLLELFIVSTTATQFPDIWLLIPEGALTCLVNWPLASVVAFITLLIGSVSKPMPICNDVFAGKPPITRVACEPPEPLLPELPLAELLLPCASTAVGPSLALGTFKR